jgi:RNA polymerase sigma-70 factor (ECF subfamily)
MATQGALISPGSGEGLSARREREVIRAAQGGSEEAIERIYRAHWPMAHRTAYLVVHDAAAAEDIAQEAFIAALRALGRFDRRRPFGPWLHRIVVNRSIDWARRRSARQEVAMKALEDHASDERFDDEVLAALRELPPDQRAIVVLRHLLEYTPGEIARMLDLPRGTVNSRLRRGLDRVRAAMEAHDE